MTTNEFVTEIKLLKAEIAKGIRREIMLSDVIHNHVIAMRAAVVAGHLESPDRGLQWIYNTLRGPGHLPDIDEALAMGGAQAMFDREAKEHEAFRAAHPAPKPATPTPSAALQAHVFRELVNDLRDIATQWHGSQQLRERISGRLHQDVSPAGPKINVRPAGGGA